MCKIQAEPGGQQCSVTLPLSCQQVNTAPLVTVSWFSLHWYACQEKDLLGKYSYLHPPPPNISCVESGQWAKLKTWRIIWEM